MTGYTHGDLATAERNTYPSSEVIYCLLLEKAQ